MKFRQHLLQFLVGIAAAASMPLQIGLAQNGPVPPCVGLPLPLAGAVGELLNQLVWLDEDVPADWRPPSCTGWSPGPTKALLAAAGRFRMDAPSGELLKRVASVSRFTDIYYWSTSRQKWRPLFDEAAALSRPDADSVRPDFSAIDFKVGSELYSWLKENNPAAGVVYRTVVHEQTDDRLVFEVINVSPIRGRLLLVTWKVAEPEEYRQLYYVEREFDDVWSFYSLIRLGRAGSLTGTSAANYRNRTEAYFRYLTGLDMTSEPPASR